MLTVDVSMAVICYYDIKCLLLQKPRHLLQTTVVSVWTLVQRTQ